MTEDPQARPAALPMYDWPEVRQATDRLWAALREGLHRAGVTGAPRALERAAPAETLWTHPRLMLAQTCGLPFVRGLADRVTLLGAPDYGLPDLAPGYYDSVIVVRETDPRETLAAFRGASVAVNGIDSQSGHAALLHHVAPLAARGGFFGTVHLSGAHAASAAAVARGEADIAALDHVSWRLLRAHRSDAASLRVLMRTEPTPALPLIAARGTDAARHRGAIAEGIAALDGGARDALGLRGFRSFEPEDYAPLARRALAAEARVSLDQPDARGACG